MTLRLAFLRNAVEPSPFLRNRDGVPSRAGGGYGRRFRIALPVATDALQKPVTVDDRAVVGTSSAVLPLQQSNKTAGPSDSRSEPNVLRSCKVSYLTSSTT